MQGGKWYEPDRGEIWLLNLDPAIGAEIKKTRPGIIVNDDAIGVLPLSEEAMQCISKGLTVVLAIG